MKKGVVLSLFALLSAISYGNEGENYKVSNIYKGGKTAVIMTHFGTTHDDTREKTIDLINSKAKKAFNGKADVYEVYTSRIIAKRLKEKKDITKLNTTQMLEALKRKGYKNIIIQPTNIIDGIEIQSIEKEVWNNKNNFKDIRMGEPLLSSPDKYKKVIEIIMKNIGEVKPNQAVVLVGHGSYDPGNSAYAMVDYMGKDLGYPIYVGTIEGYPTFESMCKQLKRDGKTEVIVMPLMFVAGDHAKNDIATDWKENLEKKGFKVKMHLTPLGEIPEIQNMFIENAKFLETHKPIDILDKKKEYSK